MKLNYYISPLSDMQPKDSGDGYFEEFDNFFQEFGNFDIESFVDIKSDDKTFPAPQMIASWIGQSGARQGVWINLSYQVRVIWFLERHFKFVC